MFFFFLCVCVFHSARLVQLFRYVLEITSLPFSFAFKVILFNDFFFIRLIFFQLETDRFIL